MQNHPCREFREASLEGAVDRAGHAASCAECARWAARRVAREELVRSLPRLAAPPELDGRVVSALQAGARQERAIHAVQRLERLRTPTELDQAVAESSSGAGERAAGLRASAPSVLDRLVSEELSDPAKARVRRFVGSLPRAQAPEQLDALVAAALSARVPAARPSRSRFLWVSGVAAALIATLGLSMLFVSLRGHSTRYSFRVEQVPSIGALDPTSHQLLDTASGGLLALHKI